MLHVSTRNVNEVDFLYSDQLCINDIIACVTEAGERTTFLGTHGISWKLGTFGKINSGQI